MFCEYHSLDYTNINVVLEKLISLSYIGDLRMSFNLESPTKFHNILKGNQDCFLDIYNEEFGRILETIKMVKLLEVSGELYRL